MRLVRWLALAAGFLFLVGAVLQLVDFLDLYAAPPNLPDTLDMVERRLATQGYREAIWPIFLLGNLATGAGFIATAALGVALAGVLPRHGSHGVGIAAALGMAGVFGAIAQLVLIGAAQPTVETAYCDCGFKDTEIVSQIWAQQLADGASQWLSNAALVLAAIGVAVTGIAFRDRMPASWRAFSWVTAIALVVAAVVSVLGLDSDLGVWANAIAGAVIVPVWAIWLGAACAA